MQAFSASAADDRYHTGRFSCMYMLIHLIHEMSCCLRLSRRVCIDSWTEASWRESPSDDSHRLLAPAPPQTLHVHVIVDGKCFPHGMQVSTFCSLQKPMLTQRTFEKVQQQPPQVPGDLDDCAGLSTSLYNSLPPACRSMSSQSCMLVLSLVPRPHASSSTVPRTPEHHGTRQQVGAAAL